MGAAEINGKLTLFTQLQLLAKANFVPDIVILGNLNWALEPVLVADGVNLSKVHFNLQEDSARMSLIQLWWPKSFVVPLFGSHIGGNCGGDFSHCGSAGGHQCIPGPI